MNESLSETPEFKYTKFWVRVATYIIDTILLGIIISIPRWIMIATFSFDLRLENFLSDDQELILTPLFTPAFLIFIGVQVIIFWLYYAFTESRLGASPGKLVFQLRVTTTDGKLISFKRATGHAFARMLSFIPFLTGYLMAAFTDKTQALHDLLAGCIVIPERQVVTTPFEEKPEAKAQQTV
ncbi:MAG: RDD family protein [Bacteroidota bacterium]|nr:RDD family protein [Bacteroidota bacterium]